MFLQRAGASQKKQRPFKGDCVRGTLSLYEHRKSGSEHKEHDDGQAEVDALGTFVSRKELELKGKPPLSWSHLKKQPQLQKLQFRGTERDMDWASLAEFAPNLKYLMILGMDREPKFGCFDLIPKLELLGFTSDLWMKVSCP
jgi:hypothetical protein